MLRFVLRKMLNKKWMVLSLLIGNLLLVGITCTNPMYIRATLQRTLTSSFSKSLEETNAYPAAVALKDTPGVEGVDHLAAAERIRQELVEEMELPTLQETTLYCTMTTGISPRLVREDDKQKNMCIAAMEDMKDHIEIVAGEIYGDRLDEEGILDVIVSEYSLVARNLLLGEIVDIPKLKLPDGSSVAIRVKGVYRNSRSDDSYWVNDPSHYESCAFIDEELFRKLFIEAEEPVQRIYGQWYTLFDYPQIRSEDVPHILDTLDACRREVGSVKALEFSENFSSLLENHVVSGKKVVTTIWVLQAPIFVLLAVFIIMVTRQMLEMEENEIAVFKSRGASRGQILRIYFLQSLLLAAAGYAGGVFLGVFICQALGSANSFLEFVQRGSLKAEITPQVLLYGGAAAALSVLAMVLPVLRFSKVTIVAHKQRKNRRSADRPMWQKLYLDFILLAVSLYGLYSYNGQQALLAQKVQEGASLDPLLFLSSSLFMVGFGLLVLRILPLLVWLIFTLFRKWWSPALYASFLRILRTRKSQGFITVFLVLTIALGVFNAQAARTINQNEEENTRYAIGADVVLQEKWSDNSQQMSRDPSIELVYREPDFSRFLSLEGVESAAKVLMHSDTKVSLTGGTVKGVQLMGIDTKSFGETAWFKNGLNAHHINTYLNAISQNSRAVLVSRNFQTEYGLRLGDTVNYEVDKDTSVWGVVYGFVDYFPSFQPVMHIKDADGLYKDTENYLIVAHLGLIQAKAGITPYQVWMRFGDSTRSVYALAETGRSPFESFRDASAEIVKMKNDPVFQGTNGILTVGFIVVLLLCAVGFLIYWVLSIQSRTLQFGIFRAMGLSMREILTMLLNEHLFISGLSIAAGALAGDLTAKLYMPLIQLAYAASDSSLPLSVVSDQNDYIRIAVIVGAMLVICLVILATLISRMKIAQALKLGED